jgi:branched-chain amino acid transport system permease protein
MKNRDGNRLEWLSQMNSQRRTAVAVIGLVIALAAALPKMGADEYLLDILSQAGLFILLGLGLNIVVALAGLLDLGYIAFWAVGAYTVAILASPHYGIHIPTIPLMLIVVLVTSAFAVLIGLPTLRLRGDYLAIVTLGFGEIVRIALVNGGSLTGAASGIQAIDRPNIPGMHFSYQLEPYYYLILGVCVIGMILAYFIRTSRMGGYWQALRDDELAARTLGINPLKCYLLAFGIGAAFGGVSGALFAYKQTTVSPDSFTVDQSFLVLAIVVLGGLSGRSWPVALSALIVMLSPELLRALEDYRLVVFGPLLVAVVIARAHGPAIRDWAKVRVTSSLHLARVGRSAHADGD